MNNDEKAHEPCAVNTDRDLWRERDDYYSNRIFVNAAGGIGLDVGGHCIVKPIEEWHKLAMAPAPAQTTEKCPTCGSAAGISYTSKETAVTGGPRVYLDRCTDPWHLEAAAPGPQNDRNSPTLLFIGNWLAEKNDDRLIRSRIRFNHFEVAEIAESYAASLRSQLSKANEELKWRRGTAELMRQAVNGQLASLRESWNAEVAVSSGLRSQLEQVTAELYIQIESQKAMGESNAENHARAEATEAELARVRQERDTQRDGWNAEKLDHADSIVRWAAVESELSAIKKESR